MLIMYMFYKVAIPSFNRPEIITQKTLKILKRFNVDINLIHIFVIESEYEDYCKNAIDAHFGGSE
jgi:hypothetical protein